jgi:hypothetical protein
VLNNLAEVYSLWCGLFIAKENGLRTLFVFGDSLLIIKATIAQSKLGGNKLKSIVSRIKQALVHFDQVSCYYIKRGLNGKVDNWEKFTSSLNPRTLIKNGGINYCPIP